MEYIMNKEKFANPPRKEATRIGFETAERIYLANASLKTKEVVKLIADECGVNETRAYYYLYWPRRKLRNQIKL
jgi:hypothetical protein